MAADAPLTTVPAGLSSLFKYFLWAEKMWKDYQEVIDISVFGEMKRAGLTETQAMAKLEGSEDAQMQLVATMFMFPYMSYFHGALFVVIEGWRSLGFTDDAIAPLLHSPHVERLRRYRNGAFHFQKDFLDPRFTDLLYDLESREWIEQVRCAFRRWFTSRGLPLPDEYLR